jgi:hypothetical protein
MKSISPGTSHKSGEDEFPLGGGEMGALIRARDWCKTSLGPISAWPAHLKRERERRPNGRGAPGAARLSTRDSTENENATRARRRPSSMSLPSRSRFQRAGGLAPPAPGPDGSLGLPDPLGAGFLGAALAPFFVVVAWPVVSIRCVPPTPWVALDALPPPVIGPDGAVGLPDCWAFAIMTPPTSAAESDLNTEFGPTRLESRRTPSCRWLIRSAPRIGVTALVDAHCLPHKR